jgi:hypothetical protein
MNRRTRDVMPQVDKIAIGVMKAVSTTSQTLNPSTPTRYESPSEATQSTCSTSW